MRYAVEIGSGAMIYISSFIKIGLDIQKLMGGRIHGYIESMVISLAYFHSFKIRKVG
jgi:hypothetical protein